MTDNSAYRVASTQSSGAPAEVKTSDNLGGGADAAVNFDMTSNTAYSSTSYK